MTIEDVIRYGGVGYRLSCIAFHRGSSGDGYIDVNHFYKIHKNNGIYSGAAILSVMEHLTFGDMKANDWVIKGLENKKLVRLVIRQF